MIGISCVVVVLAHAGEVHPQMPAGLLLKRCADGQFVARLAGGGRHCPPSELRAGLYNRIYTEVNIV